jgi:methanogenic corrinoid protein MtbC1
MTGLITEAYASMKKTIQLLEQVGLRASTTVIIGGLVNEPVFRFVGADHWVRDAAPAVGICKQILAGTIESRAGIL